MSRRRPSASCSPRRATIWSGWGLAPWRTHAPKYAPREGILGPPGGSETPRRLGAPFPGPPPVPPEQAVTRKPPAAATAQRTAASAADRSRDSNPASCNVLPVRSGRQAGRSDPVDPGVKLPENRRPRHQPGRHGDRERHPPLKPVAAHRPPHPAERLGPPAKAGIEEG